MKPITHAKIKYALMTVKIAPFIFANVVKLLWYWNKDKQKVQDAYDATQALFFDRKFETERTYRFHKLGYELIIK